MRFILLATLALVLAGCGGLPGQGPAAITITSEDIEGDAIRSNYVLLSLDSEMLNKLHAYRPAPFAKQFQSVPNRGRSARLGIGDRLVVTIWEAAADGLFEDTELRPPLPKMPNEDVDEGSRRDVVTVSPEFTSLCQAQFEVRCMRPFVAFDRPPLLPKFDRRTVRSFFGTAV